MVTDNNYYTNNEITIAEHRYAYIVINIISMVYTITFVWGGWGPGLISVENQRNDSERDVKFCGSTPQKITIHMVPPSIS